MMYTVCRACTSLLPGTAAVTHATASCGMIPPAPDTKMDAYVPQCMSVSVS